MTRLPDDVGGPNLNFCINPNFYFLPHCFGSGQMLFSSWISPLFNGVLQAAGKKMSALRLSRAL
jgi:hypothetical protein